MTSYILVWGILPGTLLLLTIWSWVKFRFFNGAKEQTGLIFKQVIFCLVALVLSILILSTGMVATINEKVLFAVVEDSFVEWLIYPVILVVLATLGQGKVKHK